MLSATIHRTGTHILGLMPIPHGRLAFLVPRAVSNARAADVGAVVAPWHLRAARSGARGILLFLVVLPLEATGQVAVCAQLVETGAYWHVLEMEA